MTAGAIQSNHVRQTAAIAAKYGLKCVALLENPIRNQDSNFLNNGNKLLTELFNAQCVMCNELTDPNVQMKALINQLKLEDAYIIPVGGSDVLLWDNYFAPMYGMPNKKGLDAITLLAQKEGILLDPVYTGKAMAGLIDNVLNNTIDSQKPLLFVHTGGAPALFAYSGIDAIID
ncbi:pyridoxal-phosphate dependent enzyme [Xenorhabdus nematophila]|nr:pyridoxal-phosphate dependent enzyme [Xenorhabdus nematophila]KHD29863.1 hypothetical protein LH67_00895 [Xenorhabdus nematophila]MBA0020006.1 pyridoxal-phosphate dependent enzyme [Xenorhabdus nematophila]MCB4423880.1 hypothetical protein [Xenorhabdus nematophila]QNJ35662.1 pyridoxal-phosphate dependent enzyme [Xenorhabdus nematophila]